MTRKMKRDFYIHTAIRAVIVLVFECLRENDVGKCGIPIWLWFEIGYAFEFIGVIPTGYMAWNGGPTNLANLSRALGVAWSCSFLVLFLRTGWVIYGYILYFSPQNNCLFESKGSKVSVTIMLIFLFVGNLTVLMCACFCLFSPLIIYGLY